MVKEFGIDMSKPRVNIMILRGCHSGYYFEEKHSKNTKTCNTTFKNIHFVMLSTFDWCKTNSIISTLCLNTFLVIHRMFEH